MHTFARMHLRTKENATIINVTTVRQITKQLINLKQREKYTVNGKFLFIYLNRECLIMIII